VGILIISEEIKKLIEEWNPYGLEDSIYGIKSFEIYKRIKGRNNNESISQEEITHSVQAVLKGYPAEMNKEVNLEWDECLKIAKKIADVIEINNN
jgi:hypothetical protein